MSSFEESFPVKWELRPVPVCMVKQDKLCARFVAYKSSIAATVLEEYAQEFALPEVTMKGEWLFSENRNMTVRISCPLGDITPEVFTVAPQELVNPNTIYSKVVKLAILNPLHSVVTDPVQLSISFSDDRNFTESFVWPCINGSYNINVNSPNGIGIQENHHHHYHNSPVKNGHSSDYVPDQFFPNDSSDVGVVYSASTPHSAALPKLLRPTPLHPPSPIMSESSSSSYHTPPESLESTPPRRKTEYVQVEATDVLFTPITKPMSDDTGDSGVSSMISKLSFGSPTPSSSKRSLQGSDCEISSYFKSNPATPRQTPSKPRCQSVPVSAGKASGGVPTRPHSSRRQLYQWEKNIGPLDLDKRPPWR